MHRMLERRCRSENSGEEYCIDCVYEIRSIVMQKLDPPPVGT